MAKTLQLKRGIKNNLPTLQEGEPVFVTDEQKLYIGTVTGSVSIGPNEILNLPLNKNIIRCVDSRQTSNGAGTFSSGGWRTRPLNTTLVNNITYAYLSNNRIILPDGYYYCSGSAPAFYVSTHQTRIFNYLTNSEIFLGTIEYSRGNNAQTRSYFQGFFSIVGSGALEIQHRCETSRSNNGFGVEGFSGINSIYAEISIWKIS